MFYTQSISTDCHFFSSFNLNVGFVNNWPQRDLSLSLYISLPGIVTKSNSTSQSNNNNNKACLKSTNFFLQAFLKSVGFFLAICNYVSKQHILYGCMPPLDSSFVCCLRTTKRVSEMLPVFLPSRGGGHRRNTASSKNHVFCWHISF